MAVCVLILLFAYQSCICGLILPLTKSNGDVDLSSLLSHVTLMEQTVTSVQAQLQKNTNELTILKTKLQTTEVELQSVKGDQKTTAAKLAAAESQLTSTKGELTKIKDDLKFAEIEIALLKLNDTTTVPIEFKTLASDVETLKREHQKLTSQFNYTVLDVISSDVKSFTADITAMKSNIVSLNFHINNTNSELRLLETQFYAAGMNTSDLWNSSMDLQPPKNLMYALQNITDGLYMLNSQMSTKSNELFNVTQQVTSLNTKLTSVRNELTLAETELTNLRQAVTDGSINTNDTALKNISDLLGADIVFQMSLSNGQNNWKTLIFDTVVFNPSSAYNETSGIFTAPVPGNYLFWANMHVDYNNYGHTSKYVYLKSGSKTLATGFTRTSTANTYGVISLTTVVHLEEGDDVYFYTDSIANVIEGDGVSSYGGALLHITL